MILVAIEVQLIDIGPYLILFLGLGLFYIVQGSQVVPCRAVELFSVGQGSRVQVEGGGIISMGYYFWLVFHLCPPWEPFSKYVVCGTNQTERRGCCPWYGPSRCMLAINQINPGCVAPNNPSYVPLPNGRELNAPRIAYKQKVQRRKAECARLQLIRPLVIPSLS